MVFGEKMGEIRVKLGCVFGPFFDGFIDANGSGDGCRPGFLILGVEMKHKDEVIISLSRK